MGPLLRAAHKTTAYTTLTLHAVCAASIDGEACQMLEPPSMMLFR